MGREVEIDVLLDVDSKGRLPEAVSCEIEILKGTGGTMFIYSSGTPNCLKENQLPGPEHAKL
jgi:hypothetical protein